MSKHDDKVYLAFILECIEKIESYCVGESVFEDCGQSYDATLRQLQIMAESTQRLSDAYKTREPDIPWHGLAGLRNILVHQYLGNIFPDKIERHVKDELPLLKQAVKRLLGDG